MGAVQHGSTAIHPDAGGLAGTREDGDLHGWTRVDVLPPGMQEVSGWSPLSSTVQKRNSNRSNSEYSRKVQQRRPVGPPYVCSDRASSPGWGLLAGHRVRGAESVVASLLPGQNPVLPLTGPLLLRAARLPA